MVRACVGLLAAAFLTSTGAAQDLAPLLPLPQLSQCSAATHPRLPEKWRAVFLMAPFTNAQLVLGEIIHDGSIPATRVRLHGVRNGSAEFLIAGSNTYVPGSRDSAAQPCRNLGDTG